MGHSHPANQAKWALRILLGVGLLLLLGGGVWTWKTWQFTSHAKRVTGTIERLEVRVDSSSRNSDDGPTYAPVFSFHDMQGRGHEVTSSVGHGKSPYEPGQTVPVLYDPDHPEDARIHSFVQLWLFPMVLSVMGLVFAGLAAVGWRKTVIKG